MSDQPAEAERKPPPWLRTAALTIAGLFILIAIVGLVSRALASQKLSQWTAAQAVPTVSVISPAADGAAQALTLPGDVQANYNAVIHARVSGYLRKWYDDIGTRVKSGQVLADIDTPELDQQLDQAKANLNTAVANQKLAQITAKRWTDLLTRDAVSRQEADEKTGDLEAKNAAVQAAQAEVNRIQALESFKHIVAPFDGVVTARTTDIGALIAAGEPNDPGLFTVADVRRVRIYVRVPQSYVAQITQGQVASLTLPEYPDRTFQATVTSTDGAISAQSGTLLVELQADNAAGLLKPGDYAQVRFSVPAQAGQVRLPASALMFRETGMMIATVGSDDRVMLKHVKIGQDQGAFVNLSAGVNPTDRVIDNPPDSIADHELVRLAASGKAG